MTDVFISYAREDTDFVRRVYEELLKVERDAWVDWEDIPLTADWLAEAYAGIEGADAFLFVISPASVRSSPCTLELEHALRNNKRFIPLLRREVLDAEDQKVMHPALSAHNWLRFRDEDDFDRAFSSVVTALDTDLEYVRAHTRYVVRAAEWDDRSHDQSFLLRGSDLTAAERWLSEGETKTPKPTDIQRDFIHASRQGANRRQRFTLLTAFILILITGLALFAEVQRRSAVLNEEAARAAEAVARFNADQAASFALAANAQQALFQDNNTDLAIAVALEANRIPQPPALAGSVLAQVAYAPGARSRIEGFATVTDSALTISPDGNSALLVSDDNALVVMDSHSHEELARWELGQNIVAAVFRPAETVTEAVIVLRDGSMTIINLTSGERREPASEDDRFVDTAVFSNDGRYLIAGYQGGAITQWDADTGEESLSFYSAETTDVTSLAISSSGRWLSAGFDDGSVVLWSYGLSEPVVTLEGHTARVQGLDFDKNGLRLVSGAYDNMLILWDVEARTEMRRFIGHTDRVQSVTFSPDNQSIFSGSLDGSVIQWNANSGENRKFVGHTSSVYAVDVTLDGSSLFSGSADGTIRIWDVQNGAQIGRFEGHTDWIYAVAFSPDGTQALSGSRDNSVLLWNLVTAQRLRRFQGHTERVQDVVFSPDGRTALSSSADRTIILWNLENGEIIRRFTGHTDRVWSVAYTPDGRTALSGSWDGSLILWDIETGREIRRFRGHTQRVYNIAISPDGKQALSGSSDATAILWNLETGERIATLEGHDGVIYDVAFSPDGRTALTASLDLTIRLWDLATAEQIRRFDGHTDDVFSVAFSPDGASALSASLDSSVRLWDIARGAEILRFNGHRDGVWDADFSPDGHSILSGGYDTIMRQWQIASLDELIQWTYANRYIAPLTCEQREIYRLTPCEADGIAPTSLPYLTATPSPTMLPTATTEVTATAAITPTVTPTLTPLPTLAAGDEVHDALVIGKPNFWQFTGQTGQVVDISMIADKPATGVSGEERVTLGLLDTLLIVVAPDGRIVAENDDSNDETNSRIAAFTLPVDGTYTIIAGSYQDANEGGYTLSIVPSATDEAEATTEP